MEMEVLMNWIWIQYEEDLYDRARALEYGDWNVSWLSS
jgi:hypothetical protein